MRKLKPIFVAVIVVLGGLYYIAHSPHAQGRMYGMGMGQGMMGGTQGSRDDSNATINPSHANALLNYINNQGLQCLQCHAVSTSGFGPSFASVAIRYTNKDNATNILSDHIAHGFGRMPPGLATNEQATQLAKLILDLTRNETNN